MDKKIQIEQAIQTHLANGGKLIRGSWGVAIKRYGQNRQFEFYSERGKEKECCGLSCAIILNQDQVSSNSIREAAHEMFGWQWTGSFVCGFDGWDKEKLHASSYDTDWDAFEFGKLMWEKYGQENAN